MTDLKNKVQGLEPNLGARDIQKLSGLTGNLYHSLAVIAKRANQLNMDLKEELHQKLEEFATQTDTIEEIHENKEQIEISKFYERLPNPTLIAMDEFVNGELEYKMLNVQEKNSAYEEED